MSDRPAAVIVLAAGGGTRMKSQTPKVLHRIGGQTLIGRALSAARGVDPERLVAVVGHGRDQVVPHVESLGVDARLAVQEEQRGTGHAVQCALAALAGDDGTPDSAADVGLSGTVLVTYGDVPLLSAQTLADLLQHHHDAGNAVSVLTAVVTDPGGYGRVVRDYAGEGQDQVEAIVEHRDATEEQRAIKEINSGIYAFDAQVLVDALGRIRTDNAQGELYLTDVIEIARGDGRRVGAVRTDDVWQTEGVNDRVQLSRLGAELNRRTLQRHMLAGVTVVDPATTWVDDTVVCEPDVTLLPGVQLHGATRVATGATVGPDSTLTDVVIGAGATVARCHGSGAVIGEDANVGPFAYLRPGTHLGVGGKIGTFVETKNAAIGDGSKVPHLSYVGGHDLRQLRRRAEEPHDGGRALQDRLQQHLRRAGGDRRRRVHRRRHRRTPGRAAGRPGGVERAAAQHRGLDRAQAAGDARGRGRAGGAGRGRRAGQAGRRGRLVPRLGGSLGRATLGRGH